jgi:hypothetical protein
MKKCTRCKKEKLFGEFHKCRANKDGLTGWCKKCQSIFDRAKYAKNKEKNREKARLWYKNNKQRGKAISARWRKNNNKKYREVLRNTRYKSKYGITLDDYNAMYAKQNGLCYICGKPETVLLDGKVRWLAVDHNHATGEVRKLLCGKCNYVIGMAVDDTDILTKMIDYLKESKL